MNNTQYKSLVAGQMVKHASGKLYRVLRVNQPSSPEILAAVDRGEFQGAFVRNFSVTFVAQKDGRNFGPVRPLKPDAIELA